MIGKISPIPLIVWSKTGYAEAKQNNNIQAVASSSAKWNAQGTIVDLTRAQHFAPRPHQAMSENICPRTLMLAHGIDLTGNSTERKNPSPKLNSLGSPYRSPEIKLAWSERGFIFPTRSLPPTADRRTQF